MCRFLLFMTSSLPLLDIIAFLSSCSILLKLDVFFFFKYVTKWTRVLSVFVSIRVLFLHSHILSPFARADRIKHIFHARVRWRAPVISFSPSISKI